MDNYVVLSRLFCEIIQSVVLKSFKEGRAALPCSTLQVGSHSSYENEIRTLVIEYLVEEEIVSEDEIPSTTDAIELKRLELQDKEKEHEAQLKMKEMEELRE